MKVDRRPRACRRGCRDTETEVKHSICQSSKDERVVEQDVGRRANLQLGSDEVSSYLHHSEGGCDSQKQTWTCGWRRAYSVLVAGVQGVFTFQVCKSL